MKLDDLGDVIATRTFNVKGSTNSSSIQVLIGRPQPYPDSTDFFTPYQIRGQGPETIKFAGGIDSVQSLQLAMNMIGYELNSINESLGRILIWAGDKEGGLGF